MILSLQCDECGEIGSPEKIATDYAGNNFFLNCSRIKKLEDLKAEHARKKDWLDKTHLKTLHELEDKIQALSEEIGNPPKR